MAEVSLLEQFVAEHRAERRRERHREMERDSVRRQPAHHAEEREVSFGESFEEPVFLEEIFVLRVPDERQMGVEDERERGDAWQPERQSRYTLQRKQGRFNASLTLNVH